MGSIEPVFDDQGLVPGIVQDAATGRVLMLAYVNQEALEAMQRTGQAHFWSRSRKKLWHKWKHDGGSPYSHRL